MGTDIYKPRQISGLIELDLVYLPLFRISLNTLSEMSIKEIKIWYDGRE